MAKRWKHRPEGSNWGDFGNDDQLGRLNLLTPEKVRQGVAEVREGKAFCLSLPLDFPGGNVLSAARFPPELRPTYFKNGRPRMNYPLNRDNPAFTDVMCDDAVLIHLQYSTQWDSLAHMGAVFDADGDGVAERVYYNGFRADEHVHGPVAYEGGQETPGHGMGAAALGIETMAETCVQGRAVMVDLFPSVGRTRKAVGYEGMMRAMEADGVTLEKGDMLCLHTGFGRVVMEQNRKPDADTLHGSCAVLDGSDTKLLRWITDSGISVLVTDNYAVEHYHRDFTTAHVHGPCAAYPLHEHCLFKLGLPLGELWYLSDLADWLRAHKRHKFLMTAPPLRLPGAVGSPATPVATV